MSVEIDPYESPPILIPVDPPVRPRKRGIRLIHLLYTVLYVALFCWLGVMTGFLLVSGFFGLLVAIVIGGAAIYGRRRSTQQDALLWALSIAAERQMPLAPTFEAFAGQSRGEYRRKVLAAAHHLRRGSSLSDVVDYESGLFPRDVRVLLRVGGGSKVMSGALRESASARAWARRPWFGLAFRIFYLSWVIFVLELVVCFISYFIMPKFEAIFSDFGIPLPSITIACIEVTHFFVRYFFLILPIVILQVVLMMLASLSVLGVLPWDLPVIDRIFKRRHSALVLRCLSLVVEEDRPMAQGLATLAHNYPAYWFRRRLQQVAQDVDRGEDWCAALARRGLIRPAEAVLLESARRVGNLPWALREAAETSERRLAYQFQLLAQWVLPLVVLAIGAMVFFVAVAYLHPADPSDPEAGPMSAIAANRPGPWRCRQRRRAFTMVEVTLSVLLLTVAMTATVQILGLVAIQRREVERRQWAIQEVANLMEHLSADSWERINADSARSFVLSDEIRRKLPEPELSIEVDKTEPDRGEKRLAIRLRWRNRGGEWAAPVRLTAWVSRPRSTR